MASKFSGKEIIFTFKDKKISKSAKDNKRIHWRTDVDIERELRKAFKATSDISREKERSCLPRKQKDVSTIDQDLGESSEGTSVSIEITIVSEKTFLIGISFGEGDADKDAYKKNKIWFTDAIAHFYKELKSRPTTIHFLIDTVPPIA